MKKKTANVLSLWVLFGIVVLLYLNLWSGIKFGINENIGCLVVLAVFTYAGYLVLKNDKPQTQ